MAVPHIYINMYEYKKVHNKMNNGDLVLSTP